MFFSTIKQKNQWILKHFIQSSKTKKHLKYFSVFCLLKKSEQLNADVWMKCWSLQDYDGMLALHSQHSSSTGNIITRLEEGAGSEGERNASWPAGWVARWRRSVGNDHVIQECQVLRSVTHFVSLPVKTNPLGSNRRRTGTFCWEAVCGSHELRRALMSDCLVLQLRSAEQPN